jgi:hypothetical protein
MKYVVKAKIYDDTKAVVILREVENSIVVKEGCFEGKEYDLWVDVFSNKKEAEEFLLAYQNA